jgi:hypothetical protein
VPHCADLIKSVIGFYVAGMTSTEVEVFKSGGVVGYVLRILYLLAVLVERIFPN